MALQSVYFFPSSDKAALSEVGGKGLSLIQGSQAGLPVPSGFILSVTFFNPWFEKLQTTLAWKEFIKKNNKTLEKTCQELKKEALKLFFTSKQEEELLDALKYFDTTTLFAVRSSSPEEDLEGSSFAGGYETFLGVSQKNIKDAIKKAFMSCLDYRVIVYKQQNGFDIQSPKIAVIIQEQIASEIAGVGFSLNPVTNNFDEAVFNANFGLGETVVQGIATPDTYTVDKYTLAIKNKQLGSKKISIWLLQDGGTKEKKNDNTEDSTLSENQIQELTQLIKKVEDLYQKPIDIEWAFAKGKLYLLQARPITGFVPLTPKMLTQPGERKRLYMDVTISIQGIVHPLSVMADSMFREVFKTIGNIFFNRDLSANTDTSPAIISNGKLYMNLSFLLLLLGRQRIISFLGLFDTLSQKAFLEIDEKEYIPDIKKIMVLPWKLSLRLPALFIRMYKARKNPHDMHEKIQKDLEKFLPTAQLLVDQDLPVQVLTDKLIYTLITYVFLRTVPVFITGVLAFSEVKKIAGEENKALLNVLDKSLPNNPTTQMGLELSHLSASLPENLTEDKLFTLLKEKKLPEALITSWNEFLRKYGFRGPEEIDIAAPRYFENPKMLLSILLTLKNSRENTQEQFNKYEKERKEAFATLYQRIYTKTPKQAKRLQSLYNIYETFAGYREIHKYYLAYAINLLRQKVLQKGKILFDAKRLTSIDQVFDLSLSQLDNAFIDPSLDLQEEIKQNRVPFDKAAKIPHPPTLIDSRGLIIEPQLQLAKKGEVIGTAVSPGITRGKIKVLHTPTEKPLHKGEILVAKATDPGWTPLFINASAVILEIGGMLQHGALVAREYGLPCVTGVESATTLWKDGTLVEVDGSTGIIREIKK